MNHISHCFDVTHVFDVWNPRNNLEFLSKPMVSKHSRVEQSNFLYDFWQYPLKILISFVANIFSPSTQLFDPAITSYSSWQILSDRFAPKSTSITGAMNQILESGEMGIADIASLKCAPSYSRQILSLFISMSSSQQSHCFPKYLHEIHQIASYFSIWCWVPYFSFQT